MAIYQKCDIKVENMGGLGGEVGWIFATYSSVAAWAGGQQTRRKVRNGSTGRLTRLLAAAALNAHGTNASPGGLSARTHIHEIFSCWCGCKS